MRCKEVPSRFSRLHDGEAGPEEEGRLRRHLAECGRCAAEWERFKEILGSLPLLRESAAPPGFEERVLARAAASTPGPGRPSPWRLVLSPAGAALCLALLLAGALLGFAAGRKTAPSPLARLEPSGGKDGVVFLKAPDGAGGAEYALVPLRRATTPPEPPAQPEELFIGGSESLEFYLKPRHGPPQAWPFGGPSRAPAGRDMAQSAVVQASY